MATLLNYYEWDIYSVCDRVAGAWMAVYGHTTLVLGVGYIQCVWWGSWGMDCSIWPYYSITMSGIYTVCAVG